MTASSMAVAARWARRVTAAALCDVNESRVKQAATDSPLPAFPAVETRSTRIVDVSTTSYLLTYSTSTTRRRRTSHSQRGGRRPRGDVSPTSRVVEFHTARSIKMWRLASLEPPSITPAHKEQSIGSTRGSQKQRSNTSIRPYWQRRRPVVDGSRARTRRPRRTGVDGISRCVSGLFGHGVRR